MNTMGWNTAYRPNGVVFLLLVYYFDICPEHETASRLSDWNSSFLLGRTRFRISVGDRTISGFHDFTLFRLAESGRYINLGTAASELAHYFRVVSYNFVSLTSHHIDWFGLPV